MSVGGSVVGGVRAWLGGMAAPIPKGAVLACLVILERLRERPELDLGSHLTTGGGQIKGLGGRLAQNILKRMGEDRPLPGVVGGRTNRGNHKWAAELLRLLRESGFAALDDSERLREIDLIQREFVRIASASFDRERLRVEAGVEAPIRLIIEGLLRAATVRKQAGLVAQHLVGAKLELRFRGTPALVPAPRSASASDAPTGAAGDFQIRDTAIHVTVNPRELLFAKCEENILAGLQVLVLVPTNRVVMARGLAEQAGLGERLSVESVESFVGQNLAELGEFGRVGTRRAFAELIEVYNRRVAKVEHDRSVLVDLPKGFATP